jgi:DNA-binding IclR family transcriptional regulator
MFELGNKRSDIVEIRSIARKYMRRLTGLCHQTVNLGYLDGHDVITVDALLGTDVIRFDAQIGNRSPAHTQAMGKAILAFLPEEELDAYMEKVDLQALTPNSITEKDALRAELAKVRELGYAMDNEEWAVGVRCVGVPLFNFSDFPSHAMSVSGPSQRMSGDKMLEITKELIIAGRALSRDLGAN